MICPVCYNNKPDDEFTDEYSICKPCLLKNDWGRYAE